MKILIVSDTHGHHKNLEKVIEKVGPLDAFIHCGDLEEQEDYIEALVQCKTYIVAGNNDYFSNLDREMEFNLGKYHVFLTHGHYYGVSMGTAGVLDEGLSRDADIIMFGHTHKPCLEYYKDITVLNPGSLSYPRQAGRCPTYLLMEIDRAGKVHYTSHCIKVF